MTEVERRERLISWLETIYSDVQDLIVDDHLFWCLQGIVGANPRFKDTPGRFTQWIAASYVQSTAVGVRRQAKDREDAVSLRRFLKEVRKYPQLVSRNHYLSLYTGKEPWLIKAGEDDFNRVAGVGSQVVPLGLVDQQLAELDNAIAGIEHYVDRRIAHYDPRGLARPVPTFKDLGNALHTLEGILSLYSRLLRGHGGPMLPRILDDWQKVFRFAWSPLDSPNP